MQNSTIAVLGGTGRFGGPYIDEFLHQGLQVRILARSPKQIVNRFAGAEVLRGSMLDVSDVKRALAGMSAAFLITPVGGNDETEIELRATHAALSAAKATRLPHLIYLSLLQHAHPTGVPLLDVKGRIEHLIHASGVPWSSLRTGCYMNAWLAFFPVWMKMGIYLFPIRSRHQFSFTYQPDVARAAAMLIRQNRVLNGSVDVIEPRTRTLQDVVELYKRFSGRNLKPLGRWVLPVLRILKPLFLSWFYPEGASRVPLFCYFNKNDWKGNAHQIAGALPGFQVTSMEAYLQGKYKVQEKDFGIYS